MVLVDTSVWVDYLRRGDSELARLLEHARVFIHPFVIGELACGKLHNRSGILRLLAKLPHVPLARHEEVLLFIEKKDLIARGVGFIDVHLLAASALHGDMVVWTRDKRLHALAVELDVAHQPIH